jgi:DNA-binding CsgD family transcriptional regulator
MAPAHRVPQSFIDSTLSFVAGIAGARHLGFFWLDSRHSPIDWKMVNVPRECHQEFMDKMRPYDPLAPRTMIDSGTNVGWLNAVAGDPSHRFRDFLGRHRFVDEVDIILRSKSDFVAGIIAFRHADDMESGSVPAFRDVLPILEKSIPYIEFNLGRYLGSDKEAIRRENMETFGLTPREAEIAELICAGCTNSDIAGCLGLGLATVKTHILHLFEKVGVENRSSLVALLPR